MNSYMSLLKLNLNKYYKMGIILVGIYLLFTIFGITIQILTNTPTIRFTIDKIGSIMALFCIFVFVRGRNGDGKFLSRLPISSFQLYFMKFITGILLYLAVFVILNILSEVVGFMLEVVGYKISLSNMLSFELFWKDSTQFLKNYVFFIFLLSLVTFLERWMSAREAVGLLLIVPIISLLLIPATFKAFNINFNFNSSFFLNIGEFLTSYAVYLKTFLYISYFTLGVFLFRLRNFKSF